MSKSPEIIDIGVEKIDIDVKPKTSDISKNENKSVNFGPGAEMLMNEKKKNNENNDKNDNLDDLNKLESELNDLTNETEKKPRPSISKLSPDNFLNTSKDNSNIKINEDIKLNIDEPKLNLNKKESKNETWDGYKNFSEIPVDPNMKQSKNEPSMSKEQELIEKKKFIRKLEILEKKGAKVSKKYCIDDSLNEIKGEYYTINSEKEKSNSIKFQGKIMMSIVTALEYLNGQFDPFDLKIDGWGESVNENIDDYDEIFEELHEKYKSKASVPPELKLLFQLGGSAVMLHMTNTMFKSAMPGMDDILKQNPDLMNQFKQAAVSSMGEQNPGFGNFMGGLMGENNEQSSRQNNNYSQRRPDIPPGPPQNRTDVGMDRGVPDFNDSVDVNQGFGNYGNDDTKRPDMKGPGDISDILGKLKPSKTQSSPQRSSKPENKKTINKFNGENGSTISIDELKSISTDADNIPRKTKRRPRSEKNTVSLDI